MFQLKPLPFQIEDFKALSSEAIKIHHGGHHLTYVNNLNKLIIDSQETDLVKIMKEAYNNFNEIQFRKVFNNAAQIWNHDFFWESICCEGSEIDSAMVYLLEKSFGSVKNFNEKFYQEGSELFGSGWVWLVYCKEKEELLLMQTHNALNPLVLGEYIPILVCDVWEHAYYLDYKNKRVDYLSVIIPKLNWQFAQKMLDMAV